MPPSPSRKRVLVLTAGFGEGHNTAAKNWADAIRRLDPSADVLIADLFHSTSRLLSTTLESLYSFAITNTPAIWRRLYDLADSSAFSKSKVDIFAPLGLQLSRILHDFNPHIIANTYPLYPHVFAKLKLRHPHLAATPIYTMVTDSLSVNSVWFAEPSDHYFVADAATKWEMASAGVPADKITVTGFPVSPLLTEIPCLLDPSSRPARILYFACTSRPHVRKNPAEIPRCLGGNTRWTLVLGHHKRRLYHTVRRFTDRFPHIPVDVLGWTDDVPNLMRTHHLVIGKAGGATVHEALTARCPMIINYVVPGQEEGNAELLEKHGCAIRIRQPRDLPAAVDSILGGDLRWQPMRDAAAKLREPLPAARVAHILLERLASFPSLPHHNTPLLPLSPS